MLSSILSTGFLLARFCHAAAIDPKHNLARADLPRVIASHEAILFGEDGRVELWNKTDIFTMNFTTPTSRPAATATLDGHLHKRDDTTIVIPNPDSTFLGWDVPMSQILHAPADSKATVSVLAGYSISNSISVSASATYTFIKDVLQASTTVTYDHTWTSTESTTNTFQIDEGKYGLIVSNPLTHRKSGSISTGRIGSEGTVSTYQADSFDSKSYGNLAWVTGVLTVCQSDTYPVPMCVGDGTLS